MIPIRSVQTKEQQLDKIPLRRVEKLHTRRRMSKAEGRRKQAEELFFLITYYENIHARRNYETDMDTRI